jgi:paxillin
VRAERVERIAGRANGTLLPEHEEHGKMEMDDGDETQVRFYCHLDFHEFFSPRCKNCKTPIEGDVVVALGANWHSGHFFCAQCGDPFEKDTPFVENEGYAWCVECHAKRFSGKCAKCKRPVADLVVEALGREWHEGCFCCSVS